MTKSLKHFVMPPLDWVRVFVLAAQHESFTLAGEELSVTPSAVSHRIHSLEQYLGVKFFDRQSSGVKLTEVGREYADLLAAPIQELERATDRITKMHVEQKLRLTVMPSFADLWLVPRLNHFYKSYPHIVLGISADTAVLELDDMGYDIGIRWGDGNYPGYQTYELFGEDLFPAASPSFLEKHDVRSIDDLAAVPLICDLNWSRDWDEWLKAVGYERMDKCDFSYFSLYGLAADAALRGQGVLMAHSVLLAEHIRSGALEAVFDRRTASKFRYYMVVRASRAHDPHVRPFVRWMLGQVFDNVALEEPFIHLMYR